MRAEPNGFEEFVTWTPATLPPSDDTTFWVGTSDNRSPDRVCAEYERLRCSRSMPSGVVTISIPCSSSACLHGDVDGGPGSRDHALIADACERDAVPAGRYV